MLVVFGCDRIVRIPPTAPATRNARAGLELLRAAAGTPYEVALLDRRMPGMDGIEMEREIRRDPVLRNTALVLLSSFALPSGRADATTGDFVTSVPKPVCMSELHDAIAAAGGCDLNRRCRGGRRRQRDASVARGLRPAATRMGGRRGQLMP